MNSRNTFNNHNTAAETINPASPETNETFSRRSSSRIRATVAKKQETTFKHGSTKSQQIDNIYGHEISRFLTLDGASGTRDPALINMRLSDRVLAACVPCRQSKLKCSGGPFTRPCQRCAVNGVKCYDQNTAKQDASQKSQSETKTTAKRKRKAKVESTGNKTTQDSSETPQSISNHKKTQLCNGDDGCDEDMDEWNESSRHKINKSANRPTSRASRAARNTEPVLTRSFRQHSGGCGDSGKKEYENDDTEQDVPHEDNAEFIDDQQYVSLSAINNNCNAKQYFPPQQIQYSTIFHRNPMQSVNTNTIPVVPTLHTASVPSMPMIHMLTQQQPQPQVKKQSPTSAPLPFPSSIIPPFSTLQVPITTFPTITPLNHTILPSFTQPSVLSSNFPNIVSTGSNSNSPPKNQTAFSGASGLLSIQSPISNPHIQPSQQQTINTTTNQSFPTQQGIINAIRVNTASFNVNRPQTASFPQHSSHIIQTASVPKLSPNNSKNISTSPTTSSKPTSPSKTQQNFQTIDETIKPDVYALLIHQQQQLQQQNLLLQQLLAQQNTQQLQQQQLIQVSNTTTSNTINTTLSKTQNEKVATPPMLTASLISSLNMGQTTPPKTGAVINQLKHNNENPLSPPSSQQNSPNTAPHVNLPDTAPALVFGINL